MAFDQAFDRWRELYRAALADQHEQNRIVLDISVNRKQARDCREARRREAESQLRLLRNEDTDRTAVRLLLLPLPRLRGLPARLLLPAAAAGRLHPGRAQRRRTRDGGDYLQRPRFLAISEFGPGALIYHEGARYEVNRVQLPMTAGGTAPSTPRTPTAASPAATTTTGASASTCARHCGAPLGAPAVRPAAAADRLHPPPRTDLQRRGGAPPGRLRAARPPTGSASTARTGPARRRRSPSRPMANSW